MRELSFGRGSQGLLEPRRVQAQKPAFNRDEVDGELAEHPPALRRFLAPVVIEPEAAESCLHVGIAVRGDGSRITSTAPLFPHKRGKGYSNPALHVVASINGVAVKNLPHLVELLRDATSEHIVVSFSGHSVGDIVLPRVGVRLAQDDILNEGGVRSQGFTRHARDLDGEVFREITTPGTFRKAARQ